MCATKGSETCTGSCDNCSGETVQVEVEKVSHLFSRKVPAQISNDKPILNNGEKQ